MFGGFELADKHKIMYDPVTNIRNREYIAGLKVGAILLFS